MVLCFVCTKRNKAVVVQLARQDCQAWRSPPGLDGSLSGKQDWLQEAAGPASEGQRDRTSLALFVICIVIHVHVRIKERVPSEIRVRGSGKTVLCSLIFKGLCPWVKTEVKQGRVRFTAFAALLGLIDGVVIVMVPLGPEFPPYPLTVHGKVDQLTCRVVSKERVGPQRQQSTTYWLSGRFGRMRGGGHSLCFSTEVPSSYLGSYTHHKTSEGEKSDSVGRLNDI